MGEMWGCNPVKSCKKSRKMGCLGVFFGTFWPVFAAGSGQIGAISTLRIRATDGVPFPFGSGPVPF
jgi:hypothetical protein